ncbi:MAG: hypothetical protein A2Y40_04210 [Candidatus Margulisbacteria bacterium GWF2_35_9]|nr:MAG: hypothetical protein A2Y40_04210 [Candidatus Margulisbacteria bacterium GWF2_35_9]
MYFIAYNELVMTNKNLQESKYFIIIYEKKADMIYLGHLDFLALWERIVRMANIPVAYSNQFQSNMKINFIQPLSLGIQGDHEFLHISIQDPLYSLQEHADKLKSYLPNGITIKKIVETRFNSKWFNKHKYAAEYHIKYNSEDKLDRVAMDNNPLIISSDLSSDNSLSLCIVNTPDKQVNINGLIFSLCPKIDIISCSRKKILFRG